MDAIIVALPKLLFSSLSALPLIIGIIAAVRHLRAGRRSTYLRHIAASIAAGAVALGLLWSSLFEDNLSKSSTSGLIFAVAPIYAAVAQAIVFGIAGAIFGKSATPQPISFTARVPLLAPILVLAVLTVGLIKLSAEGNDSAIAERTADPHTLQRLLATSRTDAPEAFGIAFHLAQNRNVSPELLSELARHDHPVVRVHVARNPRTPQAVVAALRYDCAGFVRKAVVERLGPDTTNAPAPAPTGMCALERWR